MKIEVLEGTEDSAVERERQVAKWIIRGQSKRSKLITTSKFFFEKVGEDPPSF